MKLVAAIMAICALSLFGCSDDDDVLEPTAVPDSPFLPRTSIENVLHNFREAHVQRDFEEYEKLFDHEDVIENHLPASIAFWLKRDNHFRLFSITIFITGSNVFTIPTI